LAVPLADIEGQVSDLRHRLLNASLLALMPVEVLAGLFARPAARSPAQLEREEQNFEHLERIRKDFVINVSHEV
jgi:hypothetical protein